MLFHYFLMKPLTDMDITKIEKEIDRIIGIERLVLCVGPHVESVGHINRQVVELESFVGTSWRGDSNKPMLQGIYGTAWESAKQFKAYFHFEKEAKKWDQRRIGQDLDIFSIEDEAGSTDVLQREVVPRILGHDDIVGRHSTFAVERQKPSGDSCLGYDSNRQQGDRSDSRDNPSQSGENSADGILCLMIT
ncbi:threonine--tRNA ligase [Striga asiatica]|uniref:Threonine--tRNA ligase n=1 Tax=Striga asiatica TaxID=4170 RepID=A0A5A7PIV2_STRAF|nr:threonine--tRNA ligase [Striga asiatica]